MTRLDVLSVLLGALAASTGASASTARTFLGSRAASSTGTVSIALEKRVIHEKQRSNKTRAMHKQAYFGRVSVGTPAQTFEVVFDSGSGNLLLPGSGCTSAACLGHARFAPEDSSTSEFVPCTKRDSSPHSSQDRSEIKIYFGTGNIKGHCVRDNICIGNVCTPGSFVASIEESDQPFAFFSFDGVLGLGLTSLAQTPEFSLMSTLTGGGHLGQPLFSVFLSDSDSEASEVTFGSLKREHMASDLFWVDVKGKSGFWEVTIDDIAFDNVPKKICKNCRVAVDTGTSQLAGPSSVVDELTRLLDVRRDCSNFKGLPKLGFVVQGRVLALAPRDYVDMGGGRCELSLMNLDVPPPKGPLFVLGIPFLQRYYTAYDHANTRVGFAVARHAGEEHAEEMVLLDSNGRVTGHASSDNRDAAKAAGKGELTVTLDTD